MNTHRNRAGRRLLASCAAAGMLLLAACNLPEARPDPTRYYLLSAPSRPAPAPTAASAVTVGLRRVDIPAYLRTPAIVLRPGGTEVKHSPEARWAEPLDQEIGRVLKSALQAEAAVRAVVVYPAPQADLPEVELAVSVVACEGVPGEGRVLFEADWEVRSTGAERRLLGAGRYTAPAAAWDGADYGALAAALGEAVSGLAREIGAVLGRPAR